MDMQCSRYGGIDLDNVSAFHLPMVTSQAVLTRKYMVVKLVSCTGEEQQL
jgi:hypothetical protein